MTTPKEYQDAFWRAHPTVTAPTGWWCPNCGHTVNAVVGAQPGPEPPTVDCSRCGESHLAPECRIGIPVGVPVGDDTPEDGWALRTPPDEACPKCGAAFHKHERSDLIACLRGLGAVNDALMAGGHEGGGTPAPTAGEWSVHRHYGVRHVDGDTLWCHTAEQGPSPALATLVADVLNRAEATPDLTASHETVQALLESETEVDVLRTVVQRFLDGWTRSEGRHYWIRGPEAEPMTVGQVRVLAALVRSAQNDTDGGTDDN